MPKLAISRAGVSFAMVFLSPLTVFSLPVSADGDFTRLTYNEESCFTDSWENENSFVHMLISRNPSLAEDEPAKTRAREHYRQIREAHECMWFDYAVDGFSVRGFYAKPAEQGSKKLPVVIFNRGGNADHGTFPSPYIFGKLFPIIDEGYVVIGSMYRGARINGKQHSQRLADQFGGADVNDVLALLNIIDQMPFADPERIAIWGASRGGMMAYLVARESDRLDTIIAEAAPVDLMAGLKFRPEMERVYREWIPNYQQDKEIALRERSALYWIDELRNVPILLLHGTADERVSPNESLQMASRLQALDHPYQLVMFNKGDHALHKHGPQAAAIVIDWLNSNLKGSETHSHGKR